MSDIKSRLPVRIIHNRSALPTDDDLIFTPTGIVGTRPDSLLINAMDVSVQDSNGNKITQANPLPVVISESSGGDGIVDAGELVDIPKDGTLTRTYLVPAGKLFNIKQVTVNASGKIRAEIKWGVVATEVTKKIMFNSTSDPEARMDVNVETEIPAAQNVLVIVRNDDKAAQSAYVTIQGTLITNP